MKRLVLLLTIAALFVANTIAQSNNRTINSFLAAHPEYHLLTLADLPELKDDQEYVAQFNPTARGDANGDGRADLAAIFVRKSNGKSLFSLICFHGLRKGFSTHPIWVIKDSEEQILNTKIVPKPRELVAWFCFHCDVAAVFRWNGRNYQQKMPSRSEGTNSNVDTNPSSGNTIIIQTPSGGVQVRDFYKTAKHKYSYAGTTIVYIQETKDYVITYSDETNDFLIHLYAYSLASAVNLRRIAEKDFITRLNISQNDACRLNVHVAIPPDYNETLSGKDYRLSFCPDGRQLTDRK